MALSPKIDTLVCVNNEISARIAEAVLATEGISFDRVALLVQRELQSRPWFYNCAVAVRYDPGTGHLVRQFGVVRYFMRAAALVRRLLQSGQLSRAFIVNIDNLVNNHIVTVAPKHPLLRVEVLVEGIMNFQDIRIRNRKALRQKIKQLSAPLLGLSWSAPVGHLSGSFAAPVSRVHSFASEGLMAPPEKVTIVNFPRVVPKSLPSTDAVLVVLSGLHEFLSAPDAERFRTSFLGWLFSLGKRRILVKRHPRVHDDVLLERLPGCEIVGEGVSLEDMAPDLPVDTIVGYCCTGLVTLRMMRPDIRCIDFGSDFYCNAAYYGDDAVQKLLRLSGVELVPMEWAGFPSVAKQSIEHAVI